MEVSDDPLLYRIRHSMAHVMAQAVQKHFPKVQLGFGPPTDQGFYYDFDFGDATLETADLKKIEKEMKKIIGQKQVFERSDFDADGAIEYLNASGSEPYKRENIENLRDRGVTNFSFYQNGPFLDLCEGPHVEDTGKLPPKSFKLDRIAGAYWLGDEKNKMLTRIYALCFKERNELDDFLKRRQMAEKFDHKKLGKELDLYHIDDEVGQGLPLWLPKGTAIRNEIEKFAKEKEFEYGYEQVVTPVITKGRLYERSGHLAAYKESMFPVMKIEQSKEDQHECGERDSDGYYLRPMNCPHHHKVFAARTRSYRDLPLRLAEYGNTFRYEQSGELSGLVRVRAMSMNDAHIYCSEEQLEEEVKSLIKMHTEFYATFRLKDYTVRLSIRDQERSKEKYQGEDAMWTKGEQILTKALEDLEIKYFDGAGEAAFYGPKIDFQFKNLMGREETVSTIQVDYLVPGRFGLKFIDKDGSEKVPVCIHRAPLSTHERFMSFLIEYYGGAFPTWCAPVQVVTIPVGDSHLEYAEQLTKMMKKNFMRVEIDQSNNSFNKKIRTNTVKKTPIILIVGDKEVAENRVTVRRYGINEQSNMTREEFLSEVSEEIRTRKMLREPMSNLL